MKKRVFIFLFAIFQFQIFAERINVSVLGTWKYVFGDNPLYNAELYDDESWNKIDIPCKMKMPKNQDYLWIRKHIPIPTELRPHDLYLNVGRGNHAMDVFVGGVYLGTYGAMPPSASINSSSSLMLLVPQTLVKNNEIVVACRVWTSQDYFSIYEIALGNKAQALLMNNLRNSLNRDLFIWFAMICLFLGAFYFTNFLYMPEHRSPLYYTIALLFFAFYYSYMGMQYAFIPFKIFQGLARGALQLGASFFFIFAKTFFDEKISKRTRTIISVLDIGFVVAFISAIANSYVSDMLFNLSLIALLGYIFASMAVFVRARKSKNASQSRDAVIVLSLFIFSLIFAGHDILYQFIGKRQFMYTQGLSFFVIIVSFFVVLARASARTERDLSHSLGTVQKQTNQLVLLFENTKLAGSNTSKISNSLYQSVETVSVSSNQTLDSAHQISEAIEIQKDALGAANTIVNDLVGSLRKTNESLEHAAEGISETANGTLMLLEGFSTVGRAVQGAAEFAEHLNTFAKDGAETMKSLETTMEKVQQSAHEILSVVGVLDDFAARTNLLAMNASIEAAHAGVAGKGFAVVANEIKSLASASAKQAGKISEIVTEINKFVGESAALSSEGNKTLQNMSREADTTVAHVKNAANEMKMQQEESERIAKETNELAKYANDMKQASIEQTSYSEEIVGTMQELSDASDEVHIAANEIIQGNENLSSQINALANIAEQAEQTAKKLVSLMNNQEQGELAQ